MCGRQLYPYQSGCNFKWKRSSVDVALMLTWVLIVCVRKMHINFCCFGVDGSAQAADSDCQFLLTLTWCATGWHFRGCVHFTLLLLDTQKQGSKVTNVVIRERSRYQTEMATGCLKGGCVTDEPQYSKPVTDFNVVADAKYQWRKLVLTKEKWACFK